METNSYTMDEQSNSIVNEPVMEYGAPVLQLDMNKRYTYADYLTWMDHVRRELVDGFIRLMSAPNIFHADANTSIFVIMRNYVKQRKGKCKVYPAPIDVRLPKNGETADSKIYTVVQPDVCVVCDLS
ncbi:MAG: Uma2 family endonuclease, partial [Tannerella sp.]|nr:Uma2 family endonuclease [Tannerella sp.]